MLIIVTALLSGCLNLKPATRYAPCNNWGRDCQWHKVNANVNYPPLKKPGAVDSGGAGDTLNANNGNTPYQW